MFRAFLAGGVICTIGQGVMSWMQALGLSREELTEMLRIFMEEQP